MTASHPGPGQIFLGSTLDGINFHRRPSNFLVSFLFHAAFIALIWLLARSVKPAVHIGAATRAWQAEFPIVFSGTGGGSGGSQDLLPPSTGALPRLTPDEQFAPPSAVVMNENPVLPMAPTLLMPADAVPPQTGPLGDPLSGVSGPLSNGPGTAVESATGVAEATDEAKAEDLVTGSKDSIRRGATG